MQLKTKHCSAENRLALSDNLAKIYSTDSLQITKENFHKICPSFFYLLTNCSLNQAKSFLNSTGKITDAESTLNFFSLYFISLNLNWNKEYGYGTLAILFVTLLALLGIFLLPCFNKSFYEEIIMALTSLGVGTLVSDAMLHILPEVFLSSFSFFYFLLSCFLNERY